jgi:hypothetical protein
MLATYPAAEVDSLLNDMFGQVQDALGVAARSEEKVATLQHDIELQKVAAAKPTLDPVLVDQTLEALEDLQILRAGGREKMASDLVSDPNNALRLLTRVLPLSAEAPQSGSGIPKTASASRSTTIPGEQPEDWSSILRDGA